MCHWKKGGSVSPLLPVGHVSHRLRPHPLLLRSCAAQWAEHLGLLSLGPAARASFLSCPSGLPLRLRQRSDPELRQLSNLASRFPAAWPAQSRPLEDVPAFPAQGAVFSAARTTLLRRSRW